MGNIWFRDKQRMRKKLQKVTSKSILFLKSNTTVKLHVTCIVINFIEENQEVVIICSNNSY